MYPLSPAYPRSSSSSHTKGTARDDSARIIDGACDEKLVIEPLSGIRVGRGSLSAAPARDEIDLWIVLDLLALTCVLAYNLIAILAGPPFSS